MLPDETNRLQELSKLMGFFATGGVRHPSTRMTDSAEALAIWVPPGVPEMTPEAEAAFGPLLEEVFGPRADEVHALFDLFDLFDDRGLPVERAPLPDDHRDRQPSCCPPQERANAVRAPGHASRYCAARPRRRKC
jgi:hypothetical protein